MSKKLLTPEIKSLSIQDYDFLIVSGPDGKNKFVDSSDNIYRALKQLPIFQDRIRFNLFSNRVQIKIDSLGQDTWTNIRDPHYQHIRGIFANTFPYIPLFSRMTKNSLIEMIDRVADENSVNPIEEYLESLKWDGIPRINTWLDKVYGCGETELNKIVGRNWMVQYMRRVSAPQGVTTQADYVVVLEGIEGLGKSSALRELAMIGTEEDMNGQHVEMTSLPNKKDFSEKLWGASIVEFAEGAIISRADIQTLKQQITNVSDTFRPAFGREVETYIRRCVFAMNTNETEYLKDMTGGRRWHPVSVTRRVDIQWLKENKEQLFAEAYAIHKSGEKTWQELDTLKELKQEQENRRVRRIEEDFILDWYYKQSKDRLFEGFTTMEVFEEGFKEQMNRLAIDQGLSTIIGSILLNVFKFIKRQSAADGKRYYYATKATFEKYGEPNGKSIIQEDKVEF